jgi:hypothetical protein
MESFIETARREVTAHVGERVRDAGFSPDMGRRDLA